MSKRLQARGSSGADPILVRQVFIPAAAVKTLGSIPVELVPNPGSGTQAAYGSATTGDNKGPFRAILFDRAVVNVCGGATAYDTADCDLVIQYKGAGGVVSQYFDNAILNQAAGVAFAMERVGLETATQTIGVLVPNKGLELASVDVILAAAEPFTAAGNRNLLVTVFYQIVELKGS